MAVVKGSDFLLDGGKHALRLAYSAVTVDEIDEGVRRLAAAVRGRPKLIFCRIPDRRRLRAGPPGLTRGRPTDNNASASVGQIMRSDRISSTPPRGAGWAVRSPPPDAAGPPGALLSHEQHPVQA